MDKQGVAWRNLFIALMGIVAVAVVLVIFRSHISEMGGWFGEQIESLKAVKIFGIAKGSEVLERAEAGESLPEGDIAGLKKYPEQYMDWIFKRAGLAYKEAKDYEYAKEMFNKYLDGCKDEKLKLKEGCKREERLEAEEKIKELTLIIEAKKEYDSISKKEEQIGAFRDFIGKYEEKGEGLPEMEVLVRDAKRLVAEEDIESVEGKTRGELITLLEAADSLRVDVGKSAKIIEKLRFIRDSDIANEQIKAEARFVLLTVKADEKDCFAAQNVAKRLVAEYGSLDFEYVQYSYPRFKDTKIPYKRSNWRYNKMASEAQLVLGWCYLESDDYEKRKEAYEIVKSLEDVDKEGEEGSRYELYKKTVLGLATPVKCENRETMPACHDLRKPLIIFVKGEAIAGISPFAQVDIKITKEDVKNYPKIGCWWYNGRIWDSCKSCLDLPVGCGSYITGWGSDWEKVCEDDPCELGCVRIEDKCVET